MGYGGVYETVRELKSEGKWGVINMPRERFK